jgi:ribosome-binding factor A
VSIYSTDEQKKNTTFDAIKADAKKIRFELAKVIRARTVPELNFVLDDSMEYGDKMDKLFKKINEGEKSD